MRNTKKEEEAEAEDNNDVRYKSVEKSEQILSPNLFTNSG